MMNGRVPTPIAISVIGLVAIIIIVFGWLLHSHTDVSQLSTLVFAILPSTVGVILIARTTDKIERNTNGALDNRIKKSVNQAVDLAVNRHMKAIHERLDTVPGIAPRKKRI